MTRTTTQLQRRTPSTSFTNLNHAQQHQSYRCYYNQYNSGRKQQSLHTTVVKLLLQSRQVQQSRLFTTAAPATDSLDDDDDDDDDDDGPNKKHRGIVNTIQTKLQSAGTKFRQRPVTYLIIPCIAAIVGWFTNWLAVQMIFYPINFWGVPLWRGNEIPLGLIGWQGIVPCKTVKMTTAIVDMVTTQLLTVTEAFQRLDPTTVATILSPELPKIINDIIGHTSTTTIPYINGLSFNFIKQFVIALQTNADYVFNIQNCVVTQMLNDRAKLGELFQTVATAELNFLTNSGLWFGFLLGLIQMIVALLWNNPWTLSIGGLIVGLATNWLALKWIFQPIDPTKFGPFIIQGQFLRRQKEVAAVFSNYFATHVLNANEIWNTILTDPSTVSNFKYLFTTQLQSFGKKLLWFVPFTSSLLAIPSTSTSIVPTRLSSFAEQVLSRLPNHIHVIFPYMDKTLQLESTIRKKMELMPTRKFERVLHPIFEEDELTLIIAGAVLGFLAGLIQQGLETGQIKLPSISEIKKIIQQPYNFIRNRIHIIGRNKNQDISSNTDNHDNDNDNNNNEDEDGNSTKQDIL